MTTTARFPRPIPTSADEMDMRSDDGFDFGDGDIDLDLGDVPTVQRQDDDDVAIADAASVSGENVQPVAADQDDFMFDNAEYVEENRVYLDTDAIMTTAEPSATLTATATAPAQDFAPAPTATLDHDYTFPRTVAPEDELIDYSTDDEPETYTPGPPGPAYKTIDAYGNKHDDDQNANTEEAGVQSRANSHDTHHSEAHNEEHDEADGEDGGVGLQDDGSFAEEDENEHSDHDVSHDNHDHAETAADGEQQHPESSNLQPVTVNYAGNELWLFKHHDTEETGDWLLEDISLASSSMADLFRACRASLGDDVSNEHEIGLRFDHLHNLELYEDNTACVAVSLQRLVSLYHTLQEQDENTEPESFYCSLLFRPRFATLLADIAKYAEQGSGYTGLDAAVIAGETHFSNVISGASTEHEQTDWEEEEQPGLDKGLGEYEAEQNVDASEYEDQEEQEAHTGYEEEHDQHDDDGQGNDDASHASVSHQEQVLSNADASHEYASASIVSPSQQKSPGQLGTYTPRSQSKEDAEAEARREKQEEEDLLEYSDDEEEAEEVQNVNTNGPSTSSTVQGDETVIAGDDANTAGDSAHGDQSGAHDEADFHDENEGDNQFNDQLLEGIDDTAQSYQNYGQTFDHNDPFRDFPAEGDANQDYTGFEYGALDQQLPLDFLDGGEFNAGAESGTAMNDFAGTDDFLDLNNTSEWITDQEPTSNLAEDDVVEQPAAAVSSAAIPVTTSSTGAHNASPQGQKRSVDEAGHGVDDALDSIDAKRPRV